LDIIQDVQEEGCDEKVQNLHITRNIVKEKKIKDQWNLYAYDIHNKEIDKHIFSNNIKYKKELFFFAIKIVKWDVNIIYTIQFALEHQFQWYQQLLILK
jgi:hypothetical protein